MLPQPVLGFGGRPPSPMTTGASLAVLPSRGTEVSGMLASDVDVPPEPPVAPPEPPVVLEPDCPPLPDVACPALPDVVGPPLPEVAGPPLVGLVDPPEPPDDPVAPDAPLLDGVGDVSEHAAPAAKMMPRRTEPRILPMQNLRPARFPPSTGTRSLAYRAGA